MIRALIFDFDGLILDTETPVFQAWQAMFNRYDCRLALEDWVDFIGRPPDSFDPAGILERCLGRPVNRQQLLTEQRALERGLVEAQPILPGVESYLSAADRLGLRRAIASSSPAAWVVGHLDRLGLREWFEAVLTVDQVAEGKPAPDLYLAALAALGVPAGEALALEDSPHGCLAARRAGIFCVAVPNGMTAGQAFEAADLRLSSLAEMSLVALLERVRGS